MPHPGLQLAFWKIFDAFWNVKTSAYQQWFLNVAVCELPAELGTVPTWEPCFGNCGLPASAVSPHCAHIWLSSSAWFSTTSSALCCRYFLFLDDPDLQERPGWPRAEQGCATFLILQDRQLGRLLRLLILATSLYGWLTLAGKWLQLQVDLFVMLLCAFCPKSKGDENNWLNLTI